MTLLPDLRDAVVEAAARHDEAARQDGTTSTSTPLPSAQDTRRWRRRLRWPALVGATGALAAAGLAAVLLIGPSGGRFDVVAEARAALTPAGSILHLDLEVTTRTYDGRGREMRAALPARLPRHRELWIAGDPTRFRDLTHASNEMRPRNARVPAVEHEETAWADGAVTTYDGTNGRMRTLTGLSPRSSASRPSVIGSAPLSTEDLRDGLAKGTLTDLGSSRVDGRTVRRFRTEIDVRTGTWAGTVTYDVDPRTGAPVRFTLRQRIPRFTIRIETVVRVRAYERIALDERTAPLLTIRPPAGTQAETLTLEAAREESRRARRAEEREARDRARTRRP